MKKILFISSALAILLSSCTNNLIRKSATTQRTEADIRSVTVADLDVYPERVTYTMTPSKDIVRGGEENVKRAAEAAVLQKYGNADVIVDAQYIIRKENSSITSITVTGHPAHYKNFHSVPDSVWEYTITTLKGTTAQEANENELTPKSLLNSIPKPNISFSGARFESHLNALGGYRFDGDFDEGSFFAGGTLSLGLRATQNIFVGAGSGCYYLMKPDLIYVPVFGNARFYFASSNVSPFIDLKAGYSFVPNRDEIDGGLFISPTLGYSFNHFEIGFTYTMQKTKDPMQKFTEHMVGLSLGCKF